MSPRYSELDYVLRCLQGVWGSAVLPHLVLAVTFCDPGRKAKSYRCRGLVRLRMTHRQTR